MKRFRSASTEQNEIEGKNERTNEQQREKKKGRKCNPTLSPEISQYLEFIQSFTFHNNWQWIHGFSAHTHSHSHLCAVQYMAYGVCI